MLSKKCIKLTNPFGIDVFIGYSLYHCQQTDQEHLARIAINLTEFKTEQFIYELIRSLLSLWRDNSAACPEATNSLNILFKTENLVFTLKKKTFFFSLYFCASSKLFQPMYWSSLSVADKVAYLLGVNGGELIKNLLRPRIKVGSEYVQQGRSMAQVCPYWVRRPIFAFVIPFSLLLPHPAPLFPSPPFTHTQLTLFGDSSKVLTAFN